MKCKSINLKTLKSQFNFQDDFIIIPMTNKHGQKYQCEVPKPKDYKGDEKNLDPSKADAESAEQETLEMSDLEKAKKLLEPMASQPCLLRYFLICIMQG